MSSITVQIIFFGLIGFVPNEGFHKGMTTLFADPYRADNTQPEHIPYVILFDSSGTCEEGDCNKEGSAQLVWKLDNEDLEIFGGGQEMGFEHGGCTTMFGNPRVFPKYQRHTTDFSWVPSMDRLTDGYGRVRDECLKDGTPCKPVRARLKLHSGTASACHLLHNLDNQHVYKFRYLNAKKELVFERAVADGVRVKFRVPGDSLDLVSWTFADSGPEKRKRSVKLMPKKGQILTLMVGNFPEDDGKDDHPHSDVLYSLLAQEPRFQLIREAIETEVENPGTCEAEFVDLAAFLRPKKVTPHSRTFCDGMSYP